MNISELKEKYEIKKYIQKDKKGYIYFICNDSDNILYIGKTTCLEHRILIHYYNPVFCNKVFYYFECGIEQCEKIEIELIYKIKPQYNKIYKYYHKFDSPKKISSLIKKDLTNKIATQIKTKAKKVGIGVVSKNTKIHRQIIYNMFRPSINYGKSRKSISTKSLKNYFIVCDFLKIKIPKNLKDIYNKYLNCEAPILKVDECD